MAVRIYGPESCLCTNISLREIKKYFRACNMLFTEDLMANIIYNLKLEKVNKNENNEITGCSEWLELMRNLQELNMLIQGIRDKSLIFSSILIKHHPEVTLSKSELKKLKPIWKKERKKIIERVEQKAKKKLIVYKRKKKKKKRKRK